MSDLSKILTGLNKVLKLMILKFDIIYLIEIERMKLIVSIILDHLSNVRIYFRDAFSFIERMFSLIVLLLNFLFLSLQICRLSVIEVSIKIILLEELYDLVFGLLISSIKFLKLSSQLDLSNVLVIGSKPVLVFLD